MKMELTKRMKDWLEKCGWCYENISFKELFLLTKNKDVLYKIDNRMADYERIKSRLKHFEGTVQYVKAGDRKIRTMILWKGSPGKEKGFDICFTCFSQDCAEKLMEALKKEIASLLLPEIDD